jgi:exodeoxyribonuclease VII large subunit
MNERIAGWRELLAREERLLHLYDPRRALAERRQRVDDLVRRATSAVGHHLSLARMRLDGSQARLEALNPPLVLGRGYAVVQDKLSGTIIKTASQAWPGQALRIDVHDGHLGAKVTEVDPGP